MNRKDCFKAMWIPYHKRLPPDTEELILVWNTHKKTPWLLVSHIAREDAKKFIKDKEWWKKAGVHCKESYNIALRHSHWMKYYEPKQK